jgi:hypothetical protein
MQNVHAMRAAARADYAAPPERDGDDIVLAPYRHLWLRG